jgi:uncharacterized protein (DUF3084 family)|tara:strand:+ start:469 stop:888 length:420 start_codon:yes stop_codon:yes gene_type:complete
MEIFTFILAFVSGGIVIAATYTIYLAFQANKSVAEVEIFIENFSKEVANNNRSWKSDLRVVSDNHQLIKKKLEDDHYKDLSSVNKELKSLKNEITTLNQNLNSDRKINEGEISKLYNNIQQTVNLINAVKQDQKLNQNY